MLGVAIGMGLYDSAFAALSSLYGREARSAITGITLIAGFASTIDWPMTVFLHASGWRAACLIWQRNYLILQVGPTVADTPVTAPMQILVQKVEVWTCRDWLGPVGVPGHPCTL